jgi:hypothetical protein
LMKFKKSTNNGFMFLMDDTLENYIDNPKYLMCLD